jgi:nicotinate-nucleotide pyrophosphorylase (carboxylating)
MLTLLHHSSVIRLIQIALTEDIGDGDITSSVTIPEGTRARASFLCKQKGVICGLTIAELVFRDLSEDVNFTPLVNDGDEVEKGTVIAKIEGSAHALLAGERTALNFMQRMSGVATMARRFANVISGTKTKILDTRKTIPGWRLLDKYASQCGGAVNHRIGLYDMMMIKDNHISAAGGIVRALEMSKEVFDEGRIKIEIETASLDDVQTALRTGGFHRIMFDNFTPEDVKKAVELVGGSYETEASGGITLDTALEYAKAGVDYLSTGAITHSATALDISMDIALAVPS